jgi:aspartate-semialdehyde dehydrogenase
MKVAIIGATGLVGETVLKVLEERNFPADVIFPYASERSQGENIRFRGKDYPVRLLSGDTIETCDLAFFSGGSKVSQQWAPVFRDKGALVIDKSSAFRNDPEIPLIVPEVNPQDIAQHKGIISNPNCSTIGLVCAVYPLHLEFGLKAMVVTSFQSVTGAGKKALQELEQQTVDSSLPPQEFPHPIAFNCLPQIGKFLQDGETTEDVKFRDESRKIMGISDLQVTATAVRVPVKIGHGMSVFALFNKRITVEKAQEVLAKAPSVQLYPEADKYPIALDCVGRDDTLVGRIRIAQGFPNALNLWIVVDNLRKGAATNAVQIAELTLC